MASDQPSFDFGTETAPDSALPQSGKVVAGEPTSRRIIPASAGSEGEWREVPQARFLSWSPAMQLDYCARRDEDSCVQPDMSDEEVVFYGHRAARYRAALLLLLESDPVGEDA